MTEKVSGRKYGALAVSPCYHPANKPFSFYYKTCRSLLQTTSPKLYLAKYNLGEAKYKLGEAKYNLGEVVCSRLQWVLRLANSSFIALWHKLCHYRRKHRFIKEPYTAAIF